jgi:hypothetical protein
MSVNNEVEIMKKKLQYFMYCSCISQRLTTIPTASVWNEGTGKMKGYVREELKYKERRRWE